jgi:hypothetical protein
MADLVRSADLGAVVPYQNVDVMAEALVALAADRERLSACSQRSTATSAQFRWSVVSRPLLDYCANPTPAPDRGKQMPEITFQVPAGDPEARQGRRPRSVLGRALSTYRRGGASAVIKAGARRLGRQLLR